jgi:hypothetical protein
MIGTEPSGRKTSFNVWGGVLVLVLLGMAASAGGLIAARPQLALLLLGFVVVIGYALFAHVRPFAAFVVVVVFALSVWMSGITVLPGISIMIGAGFVFIAVWISRLAFHTMAFVKAKEYGWLLGLAAVVVASTLFNLGGKAGIASVFTYLQLFLLLVLVVNLATTSARLYTLSIVIVVSSALIAVLILLDQFQLLPSGLVSQQAGNVIVEEGKLAVARAGGVWGDANFTAVQLTVALPFLLEWWSATHKVRGRLLLLSAAAAIVAALTFTLSLTGLIGLLMVLFTRAIVNTQRDVLFKILQIVFGVIITAGVLFMVLPDLYVQRVVTFFELVLDVAHTLDVNLLLSAGTNRGDTWQAAIKSILSSPLLGHGPGNSTFVNVQYSLIRGNIVYGVSGGMLGSHNMFLSVGSDLGLVGLALFAGLLISALIMTSRSWRMQTENTFLQRTGRALFIALVAYTVQGQALDIHNLKVLWILLGMAIAYKRQQTSEIISLNVEMVKDRQSVAENLEMIPSGNGKTVEIPSDAGAAGVLLPPTETPKELQPDPGATETPKELQPDPG